MFFCSCYRHDGNGRVGVEMCCTTSRGIVSHSNQDTIVLNPKGPTKNMTIEILNLSVKGEFALTLQMEGV
jgi:hypothetical protein